jgi:hypothetical protein
MPSDTDVNIQIDLEGLQMVFVDENSEKCIVGVLSDTPQGHPFKISIQKQDANGKLSPFAELNGADIKNELTLNVSNTSTTGITRRKMEMTIDRLAGETPQNEDSFRWVVDFERELYKKPLSFKKDGFLSLLTLNNGELLARKLSTNQLKTKKGRRGRFKLFGKVATRTGIDIVLDRPDSHAVFKNGEDTIFIADNTSTFTILIERVCDLQPGGNDADAFNTAFDEELDESERIFFSSTPLDDKKAPKITIFTTPDASCLPGTGGSLTG